MQHQEFEPPIGLNAVLIRPDGTIARASEGDPDYSELEKAFARWFVCAQK
jgi:hypothetical protein